jgi:hypothetical protein
MANALAILLTVAVAIASVDLWHLVAAIEWSEAP